MPIPELPLPQFPISATASQQEMQKLSDAVAQLQRTFSQNFSPNAMAAPRASLPVVVKITGGTVNGVTLGTNWYSGKMQLPPQANTGSSQQFDPAVSADLTKIYSAKNLADDCYVLSPVSSTIASGSYLVGELQGIAKPSSGALPVRPIIILTGSPPPQTSIGQYQYQVMTMTSQNQSGWDFVRAHPLI